MLGFETASGFRTLGNREGPRRARLRRRLRHARPAGEVPLDERGGDEPAPDLLRHLHEVDVPAEERADRDEDHRVDGAHEEHAQDPVAPRALGHRPGDADVLEGGPHELDGGRAGDREDDALVEPLEGPGPAVHRVLRVGPRAPLHEPDHGVRQPPRDGAEVRAGAALLLRSVRRSAGTARSSPAGGAGPRRRGRARRGRRLGGPGRRGSRRRRGLRSRARRPLRGERAEACRRLPGPLKWCASRRSPSLSEARTGPAKRGRHAPAGEVPACYGTKRP
mmetsp:Transcript_51123/g.143975  ORF Transcript_51123/g.143975 Transcript_51123/m.143975 type:complete len:278 (-) Transcript_51123:215-1048(-)